MLAKGTCSLPGTAAAPRLRNSSLLYPYWIAHPSTVVIDIGKLKKSVWKTVPFMLHLFGWCCNKAWMVGIAHAHELKFG